jgi:hypothetical protein
VSKIFAASVGLTIAFGSCGAVAGTCSLPLKETLRQRMIGAWEVWLDQLPACSLWKYGEDGRLTRYVGTCNPTTTKISYEGTWTVNDDCEVVNSESVPPSAPTLGFRENGNNFRFITPQARFTPQFASSAAYTVGAVTVSLSIDQLNADCPGPRDANNATVKDMSLFTFRRQGSGKPAEALVASR